MNPSRPRQLIETAANIPGGTPHQHLACVDAFAVINCDRTFVANQDTERSARDR